jgi:hypothetical protein
LPKIEFKSILKGFVSEPKPSLVHIPQSYKDLQRYVETRTKPTVKRCMPFLDALTTGYIIPFPTDIEIFYDREENAIKFTAGINIAPELSSLVGVSEHDSYQITENMMSPKRTINKVFKFNNPWIVTTPPGYSCLFVTPFNHILPFELISGVVDTDSYPLTINFPFYYTGDINVNTLIKEASPMAMVFPFKRESWQMETKLFIQTEEENRKHTLNIFKKIEDNYKRLFWSKKSYK